MGDPDAMPCEHCLKAAPAGKRFCSDACLRCEHESENEETGCDEICIHNGHGADWAQLTPPEGKP